MTSDRDGTLPRGGEGELEVVAWSWRYRNSTQAGITDEESFIRDAELSEHYITTALTPLLPAQERLRALEEERDRLAERLEECRGVTESAVKLAKVIDRIGKRKEMKGIGGDEGFVMAAAGLCIDVDALSPTTREWAEGSPEEEG